MRTSRFTNDRARPLVHSHDGSTLAVGVSDHTEVFIVQREGHHVMDLPSAVMGLQPVHVAERYLASALHHHSAKQTAEEHTKFTCAPLLWFDAAALQGGVALSSDGRKLVVGGRHRVQVFDVVSGAALRKLKQVGGTPTLSRSSTSHLGSNPITRRMLLLGVLSLRPSRSRHPFSLTRPRPRRPLSTVWPRSLRRCLCRRFHDCEWRL